MFDPSTVGYPNRPDHTVAFAEVRLRDGRGIRNVSVVKVDHDRGDHQDWVAAATAAGHIQIPRSAEVRWLRCASVPVDDAVDHRVLLMWLSDPDFERVVTTSSPNGGFVVPWDAAVASVVRAVGSAAREFGGVDYPPWQTGFLFPAHTEAFRAAMRRPDG